MQRQNGRLVDPEGAIPEESTAFRQELTLAGRPCRYLSRTNTGHELLSVDRKRRIPEENTVFRQEFAVVGRPNPRTNPTPSRETVNRAQARLSRCRHMPPDRTTQALNVWPPRGVVNSPYGCGYMSTETKPSPIRALKNRTT